MEKYNQLKYFDFFLPKELIAQHPPKLRSESRLLEVTHNQEKDWVFNQLPDLLSPGDVLVLNNTKVLPTRLAVEYYDKNIEITLHKPIAHNIWLAFIKNSKKLKINSKFILNNEEIFKINNITEGAGVELEFIAKSDTLSSIMHKYGIMPLPPYIKRTSGDNHQEDKSRYQTVFAKTEGAAAAPTAGLHFTQELLQQIREKGIIITYVTLHVGAGTFAPVKTEDITQHTMHSEYIQLSQDSASIIKAAQQEKRRIIAVGTTVMRTLESVHQMHNEITSFEGETNIFITPGFTFKVIDALITNFHTPKSTLFMLVSAFSGLKRMNKAYNHAIINKYRFFSYGDACFLHKQMKDSNEH